MTTKLKPQTAYHKLVSDISNIFEQARAKAREEIDRIALRARWAIGRRIVKEEQSGKLRAEYGERLFTRLARDLAKKYGAGFSRANLYHMRELYLAYPKWPIFQAPGKLTWEHYRKLLSVNDKERRDFFGNRAIKNSWSTRELASEIKKYRETLSRSPIGKRSGKAPRLSVKRGRLNTYKIISLCCGTQSLRIDCGFEISYKTRFTGVSKPKAGDIVEVSRSGKSYRFKRSQAKPSELYTFIAYVDEVIDADTLWATVNCGFDICIRQKLRLRGIDAPDISTKRGLQARRFVRERLKKVSFIIIQTHKSDKYDRYLADIFYEIGESDPERVLRDGTYLNQELLDHGLAAKM